MKKLLLGLGTVAAIVTPVASVVACGDNGYISTTDSNGNVVKYNANHDRSVLTGHLRQHFAENSITTNKTISLPSDLALEINHLKYHQIKGVYGGYDHWKTDVSLDSEEYGQKLDVDFDYKLTLNHDDSNNAFYVLDITNAKLTNEATVIRDINNREFKIDTQKVDNTSKAFLGNDSSFEPTLFKSIPDSGTSQDNIDTETDKIRNIVKKLNLLYYEKYIEDLKQNIVDKFKYSIEGVDLYKNADDYLQKYVTNFTSIKNRESYQRVAFDLSKIK